MEVRIIYRSIKVFVLLMILALSFSACSDVIEQTKPNVLFIMVDDLRPEINAYGKTQMKTPGIDLLVSEGVQFTEAYCNVPVCGASRASLLSGARPTPDRFVNYYTRKDKDFPNAPSIPKWFKQNGYTTLSLGKIYHYADDDLEAWSEEPIIPLRGIGWQSYLTEESEAIIKANRDPKNPDNIKGPAWEAADVPDNGYPDGVLADIAIEDLNSFAKSKEPFFLAVGFWKPHLPFNAPKKYWDMYDPSDIKLADNPYPPENVPIEGMHEWNELRGMYSGIPQEGSVSDDLARKLIHGYYACVSYSDAQINKILKELKKLGLDDNTIVVLMGDHGWHLGEHTLWCKHSTFQKVLNVPLIIKAPGLKGDVKTASLSEYVDIYPTLCELAGLELPKHLDGKSLVPLLKEPSAHFKDAIFSRYHDGDAVKTDRYLYTEWNKDGKQIARMLYDHQNDPDENVNVAENEDYKNVVVELSNLIKKNSAEIK